MINEIRNYISSKLTRQLAFRVIIIGLAVILLITAVALYVLRPPLRNNAVETAEIVSDQIMMMADQRLEYIKDYSDIVTSSLSFRKDFLAFVNNRRSIHREKAFSFTLNNQISARNNIRGIIVETEDGRRVDSLNSLSAAELDILNSEWYRDVKETGNSGFSRIVRLNTPVGEVLSSAYSKKCTIVDKSLYFTVFFNMTEVMNSSRKLSEKILDDCKWINTSDRCIYSVNDAKWPASMNEEDYSLYLNETVDYLEGVVISVSSEESRYMILTYASNKILEKEFNAYFIMQLLLFAGSIIILLLLLVPSIGRLTHPIIQLEDTMQEVANGDLEAEFVVDTNNQIGSLSRIFNKMIENTKNNLMYILQKEETEHRMAYQILISQMDPHFIYNTMNTITYLAKNGRCEDVVTINNALINILQDRLRIDGEDDMDTLSQEMKMVNEYMKIQSCRFGDGAELEWNVEDGLEDVLMPKNIIQPFVENALLHGMINEKTGLIEGKIEIVVVREAGKVAISVTDNGTGMTNAQIEKIYNDVAFKSEEKGRHIGLANVIKRLEYIYDTSKRCFITSKKGKGTTVKVLVDELYSGCQ